MRTFILKRLLSLIPILFGVTFLSFVLISLSPGDFLTTMSLSPGISPEHIEQLRRNFGLDKPWYVQYGLWLYRLSPYEFPAGLKWPDLGYSFSSRMPVFILMKERFVNTLILSISAEFLIWTTAIPFAVLTASRRNRRFDSISSGFLFLGISFPQILLSLLALMFAAGTGWFPIGGMHRLGYEELPIWSRFTDLLHHLFLPAFVLAFSEIAVLVRFARGALLDTLSADFIRTARAKGNSESRIFWRHALRNAINPLITLLGLSLANLISASFLVEIIMGWPGLGRLTYDALLSKDLYVLMASLITGTIFLIVGNLFADILLAITDPRIRYE